MDMPSEPDNSKIEELLKAYAKKRREQASGSFELHPAVRKMLQGEVARQKGGSPSEKPNLAALLFRWFPRAALVGAAVMVLSLVLWNVSQPPTLDRLASIKAEHERLNESKSRQDWAFDAESPAAPTATAPVRERESFKDAYTDQLKKSGERDVRVQEEKRKLAFQNETLHAEPPKKPAEGESLPALNEGSERRMSRAGAPVAQKSADELQVARQAGRTRSQLRDLDSAARAKNDKDADPGAALDASTVLLSRTEPAPTSPSNQKNVQGGGAASGILGQRPADAPIAGTGLGLNSLAASGPLAPAPTPQRFYRFAEPAPTNTFALNSADAQPSLGRLLGYNTAKQSELNGAAAPPSDGLAQNGPFKGAISVAGDTRGIIATPAAAPQNYAYFAKGQSRAVLRYVNGRADSGLAGATAVRSLEGLDDKARGYAQPVAPQPLSSTFELEEDRGRIQIRDSDGSIYLGAISPQAPGVVAQQQESDAIKLSEAQKTEETVKSKFRGEYLEPFSATGINLSLRKMVVIRANFLPQGLEPAEAGGKVQLRPAPTQSPAARPPSLGDDRKTLAEKEAIARQSQTGQTSRRGRIAGRAEIVGQTNQIRIDATQVGQ